MFQIRKSNQENKEECLDTGIVVFSSKDKENDNFH